MAEVFRVQIGTVTTAGSWPSKVRRSFGEMTDVCAAKLVQPTSASSGQIKNGRSFSRSDRNGDNRRFMAQQGAEIVRRNDGRVRGKIGPADEREQRPDQKWPKFFADENEDEEEKRSDKQRGERRLKELCEQQAGGVGKDDGDKRTVHVPPGLRIFQRSHNSSKATAPPQVSISTSETCAVREGTKA